MTDALGPVGSQLVIALGGDHAGRDHKELFKRHLEAQGHTVLDMGVAPEVEKANYPEVALKVVRLVRGGQARFGVLICGTGVGMAMVANRFQGIRAANCASEFVAVMARAHNNANILTLGQRTIGPRLALAILDAFLATDFEAGRHRERVDLFDELYGSVL
jgi:ribose 5-phosphate isomerase B